MISTSSLKSGYHGGALFILEDLKKRTTHDTDSIQYFKKGAYLYNEGTYPKGIYYILAGNVKIIRSSETGKERIIHLSGKNDIIGYQSVLSGLPYQTSAKVLDNIEVLFLSTKLFYDLLSSPETNFQMIRLLAKDIELSELKWVNMSTKSLKSRIADLLISFKEKYGFVENDNTLNIVMDREEFAEMVGVSVEAIIRRFNELKDAGIIETYGRNIRLLNLPALKYIAQH